MCFFPVFLAVYAAIYCLLVKQHSRSCIMEKLEKNQINAVILISLPCRTFVFCSCAFHQHQSVSMGRFPSWAAPHLWSGARAMVQFCEGGNKDSSGNLVICICVTKSYPPISSAAVLFMLFASVFCSCSSRCIIYIFNPHFPHDAAYRSHSLPRESSFPSIL